jgi:hypothetical protein
VAPHPFVADAQHRDEFWQWVNLVLIPTVYQQTDGERKRLSRHAATSSDAFLFQSSDARFNTTNGAIWANTTKSWAVFGSFK